jgi:hypothetical protein
VAQAWRICFAFVLSDTTFDSGHNPATIPYSKLLAATTITVFALTSGGWNKSMPVNVAVMGLAFIAGAFLVAKTNFPEASAIYAGLAFAFLVYFCYMLSQLVATLKQIALALQTRR